MDKVARRSRAQQPARWRGLPTTSSQGASSPGRRLRARRVQAHQLASSSSQVTGVGERMVTVWKESLT
ncbi:UNVERIFIED_CONTAM: hypothetical protein Slati_4401400 [Sesamum latifolium]|uniref:Uncharacterized protein n=1 Tax=Sesamum latifolium TaxID=2727402 RepID=A0AAW2SPH0_9LAMI